MDFNQKLRALRKQAGLSQEELAEKISVSRQAITKWETDNGLPDIENLIQIARLFKVSLDDLLVYETVKETEKEYIYESVTEYDVDGTKHFDINTGGAHTVCVGTNEREKIRVRLASNTLANIEKAFKVKIDEEKTKLDIDVKHNNVYTEAQAKEFLHIFIELPPQIAHGELMAIAAGICINGLSAEIFEVDGKFSKVKINGFSGSLELNSALDMDIRCEAFAGRLEVNQAFSTSVLNIPKGVRYNVLKKGRVSRISFTRDHIPFVHENTADAENVIEVRGTRAELIINEYSAVDKNGGNENEQL